MCKFDLYVIRDNGKQLRSFNTSFNNHGLKFHCFVETTGFRGQVPHPFSQLRKSCIVSVNYYFQCIYSLIWYINNHKMPEGYDKKVS